MTKNYNPGQNSWDIKVVALRNFKYFGIYFKMGYYLRISANKFEYLSVTVELVLDFFMPT